jgi:hypothetical protein
MARHWQNVFFLILAVGTFFPTAVLAQQTGNLWVQNDTATTIRIGCEHYVDANGQTVFLNTFWTLGPGQYARNDQNGQTVVAQKFVFYIITPEGETAGWFVTNITAFGNLYCSIDNTTLANHKTRAGIATSNYPPLTAKGQLKDNIAKKEQRLTELNFAIPLGEAALSLAKAENDKFQRDPNASFQDKLIASSAVAIAEGSLNALRSERNMVEYDLRIMRDRQASLPD